MPALDSPAVIVARFLKANNYSRTLDAFIAEAGLPPDAGTVSKDDLTIEKVLEEKKIFDLTLQYEKHGVEGDGTWATPVPNQPTIISLPGATNVLSVSVQPVYVGPNSAAPSLLATTAGRRLSILQTSDSIPLLESISPQDSPILSWVTIKNGTYSIGTSMSGQMILYSHRDKTVISERRDHTKYVVKAAVYEHEQFGITYVATAGWDGKVHLYMMSDLQFSNQVDTLDLPTNPEDILFHRAPSPNDPSRLILIVTRRDSTSLHFYQAPEASALDRAEPHIAPAHKLTFLGAQNLSPHSQAWSAFSPSSIALSPTDPSLLAVATSSIPFLKLILARLLIPNEPAPDSSSFPQSDPSAASSSTISSAAALSRDSFLNHPTQASQSRAALAQQEIFSAAIELHVSTQAPQTPYSTPRVAWRPDGSGCWVNGDDGVVRGVERATGKVRAVLAGGHDAGVKVRDVWAGWVDVDVEDHDTDAGGLEGVEGEDEGEVSAGAGTGLMTRKKREEWVVSGGFDRRIVVWRVGAEGK